MIISMRIRQLSMKWIGLLVFITLGGCTSPAVRFQLPQNSANKFDTINLSFYPYPIDATSWASSVEAGREIAEFNRAEKTTLDPNVDTFQVHLIAQRTALTSGINTQAGVAGGIIGGIIVSSIMAIDQEEKNRLNEKIFEILKKSDAERILKETTLPIKSPQWANLNQSINLGAITLPGLSDDSSLNLLLTWKPRAVSYKDAIHICFDYSLFGRYTGLEEDKPSAFQKYILTCANDMISENEVDSLSRWQGESEKLVNEAMVKSLKILAETISIILEEAIFGYTADFKELGRKARSAIAKFDKNLNVFYVRISTFPAVQYSIDFNVSNESNSPGSNGVPEKKKRQSLFE